jgi:hypothetical protein
MRARAISKPKGSEKRRVKKKIRRVVKAPVPSKITCFMSGAMYSMINIRNNPF